jgi:hypothetical protein
MSNNKAQAQAVIILARPDETEAEYNSRNCDEGDQKCLHNYDGQDHIRFQRCNFCKCTHYNAFDNEKYDLYFDNYL